MIKLENQNYNKSILREAESNNIIKKYFVEGKPFLVARSGGIECEIISCIIKNKQEVPESLRKRALINAGINPNDQEGLSKFAYDYAEHIKSVDIMGVWGVQDYDWLVSNFCPKAHYVRLWGIEPYYFKEPWSLHLKDKRVLVIHPFEKSISKNYKNREKLFQNPDVLPKFVLRTIKAEQNQNNIESDYFETIKRTQDKISKEKFDIAIIGCGAPGLPLASFIKKELGKTAIHLGGATQILFGIIGKRWEAYPQTKSLMNEYWRRPLPEETPKDYKLVEEGCYW